MNRAGLRTFLAMALLASMDKPAPIIPIGRRAGKMDWWRRFCDEMRALGCRMKDELPTENEDGTSDIEWEIPAHRLDEAKAVMAKYLTEEAREAYGLVEKP